MLLSTLTMTSNIHDRIQPTVHAERIILIVSSDLPQNKFTTLQTTYLEFRDSGHCCCTRMMMMMMNLLTRITSAAAAFAASASAACFKSAVNHHSGATATAAAAATAQCSAACFLKANVTVGRQAAGGVFQRTINTSATTTIAHRPTESTATLLSGASTSSL